MVGASRAVVTLGCWVHEEVLERLRGRYVVRPNASAERLDREELVNRCRDADGLVAGPGDVVDRAFLDQCPGLRVVADMSGGLERVDVRACTERGVWVTSLPGLVVGPVAELAVGLMIGVARHVAAGDRVIRRGAFEGWRPTLYGRTIAGAMVGIVGMGRIGRAIAQRVRGFDIAGLIYCDPVALPEPAEARLGASRCELPGLLVQSDFVVVTAPLTEQTRGLIGVEELALIKRGAHLVNIGRGAVVDELAVVEALDNGRLAGYAADVFEMEDVEPGERPRWMTPGLVASPGKTLLTPRLGSAVEDCRRQMALRAVEQVIAVLEGRAPGDAVNGVAAAEAQAAG